MSSGENDQKSPAIAQDFELFLRLSSGTRLRLQGLSAGNSVRTVKEKISGLLPDTPSDQQRVIYKGRILEDDKLLSDYSIVHQSTLFLVVSRKDKGNENANNTTSTATTATTTTSSPTSAAAVLANEGSVASSQRVASASADSSGASASSDWMAQILRQQQQMMQQQGVTNPMSAMAEDPAATQQLLNSPFMQRILDNPDFITSLLQSQLESNPALQRMMDENPSLRHMLGDPAALQQAAELLRNPAALQQAMRQQDLALSQLENMPGGFAALSNMYRNVQAPLEESLTEQSQQSRSRQQPADVSQHRHDNQGATGTAMPNPWGSSSSSRTTAAATSRAPSLPQQSPAGLDLNTLLREMNPVLAGSSAPTRTTTTTTTPARTSSNSNPWANLGSASGTSTVPDNSNANLAAAFAGNNGAANPWGLMMQDFNNTNNNPLSQQNMLNLLESPMMRTLIQQMQEHPEQYRSMFEADPTFRTMFGNNPEAGDRFIQSVMNPEVLRSMMMLQREMGASLPPAGGQPQWPYGGLPQGSPNPWGGGGSVGDSGLDFSSILRGLSASQPQPPPTPQDPRERYRRQLQQLADMGFDCEESCLTALQAEHGNLNRTVDRLLSGPPPSSASAAQPPPAVDNASSTAALPVSSDNMDIGSTASVDNDNNEPSQSPPPPKDAVDKKND